jgi:thiol-disulfide isomerase/thioredoxin
MVTILKVDDDQKSAANLDRLYVLPDHHIVVLYHNKTCPPCLSMKPAWTAACANFKSNYASKCIRNNQKVVIANVDENGIRHLNKVYKDVQGTPTIAHIHHDGTVTKYEGDRSKEAFLTWLNSTLGKHCDKSHSRSHGQNSLKRGGRKKNSQSVPRIRRGRGTRRKNRSNRR